MRNIEDCFPHIYFAFEEMSLDVVGFFSKKIPTENLALTQQTTVEICGDILFNHVYETIQLKSHSYVRRILTSHYVLLQIFD